jgi:superfamily II DNA or RNA helicase
MTREEKQQELIKIGVENKRCTLVASTGLGKTYIALEIIKQLKPKTVLWVGPSANLEENVKKEIVKWNFNEEVDLQIKTIQLAYKFENQYYDLLIGDESHTIVTEEYSKLLLNNNFNNIIFLTATPEDYKEEKRLLYEKYAPIKVRYSNSEEDGFTNKIQIYHFTYDLTDNFKFKIEYRKGKEVKSFNKGELTHYDYLNSQIVKGRILIMY